MDSDCRLTCAARPGPAKRCSLDVWGRPGRDSPGTDCPHPVTARPPAPDERPTLPAGLRLWLRRAMRMQGLFL